MADQSAASGLQAALLLAQGRADGVALIADDMPGAARSFRASLICLPAFLALRLLDWAATGDPPAPWHALAMDLLVYAMSWAGYALLSLQLARALGRAAQWPRFISAWNWCNVVQYLLLLAAEAPSWLGAPDWIGQVLWIVALFWSVWLEWFAARLTLGVSAPMAMLPVLLDLVFGTGLSALTGAG